LLVGAAANSDAIHDGQTLPFPVLDPILVYDNGFFAFAFGCFIAGLIAFFFGLMAFYRKEAFWQVAILPAGFGLAVSIYTSLALLVMHAI